MSHAMHRLARPRAAAHVAGLVWSLVTSRAHGLRHNAVA
jgi:hypothetical protein